MSREMRCRYRLLQRPEGVVEQSPTICSGPLPARVPLGWHETYIGMITSRLVAKQVGVSGKISLGKEYAGRTMLIDSSEPGV